MRRIVLAAALASALSASAAASDPGSTPPARLHYQTRLTDTAGAPVHQLGLAATFRLYDAGTSGAVLWEEARTVDVLNGLLSVELGAVAPLGAALFTQHDALWLGVALGTDSEMVPRLSVASVPFALRAESARSVTGPVDATDVAVDGQLVIDASGQWVGDPTGLVGPAGPAGPTGAQGVTGPQGDAGPAGPAGPTGPNGPIGPAGPQGPQGPQGQQGQQGLQGPEGPIGPQGSPGTAGPAGPTGPAGPQGLTGPEGPMGKTGAQGPAGPQGPIGKTGPAGPAGPAGDVGPVGPAGPAGPIGPMGPMGPAGPQGPKGPEGPIGKTGPAGPQGPIGKTGPAGPAGPQGPTGPAGDSVFSEFAGVATFVGGYSYAGLVVAPSITTSGKDSRLDLMEDHDGTYGMRWNYDGDANLLSLRGLSSGSITAPHITVARDSGDVGFGPMDGAPQADLHISGYNDSVSVLIEADRDNSNEYDQPQMTFSQDGGTGIGEIGFFDGTNDFELRNSFGAGSGIDSWLRLTAGGVLATNALDVQGVAEVNVLEVTGGADLAEPFATSGGEAEPGTVMVIDPERAGHLKVADTAYDRRVAGVVSGAGGVNPGLSLSQPEVLEGDTKVALAGRVYVKASIENGPIRPGDALTTAALAGHAMRATDAERTPGAVLGKAMTALDDGTGLVLVLVNLQ
jgi:hypothetical protein